MSFAASYISCVQQVAELVHTRYVKKIEAEKDKKKKAKLKRKKRIKGMYVTGNGTPFALSLPHSSILSA